MTIDTVLLLLVLLTVKHYICDFVLQSGWMIAEKGHYGRLGGIVHSGIHGVATVLILLLITKNIEISVILALLDMLTHYHLDWIKSRISKNYRPIDKAFWNWLGADQLAHQLVYLLIVYILLHLH